jgi:hypothetical protein
VAQRVENRQDVPEQHIDSGNDRGDNGGPGETRDDVEYEEHGAGDGQQKRHQTGLREHRGRLHEP